MSSFRIIALVACLPLLLVEAKISAYMRAKDECINEIGAITSGMDTQENTKREECYKACEMIKLGSMSPRGEYKYEHVIDQLPKDFEKFDFYAMKIRECTANSQTNQSCQTAGRLYNCFQELWAPDDWQRTLNTHRFMFLTDLETRTP